MVSFSASTYAFLAYLSVDTQIPIGDPLVFDNIRTNVGNGYVIYCYDTADTSTSPINPNWESRVRRQSPYACTELREREMS